MVTKALRSLAISLGYHSKPSFIIAGAQKCGTTALFSILKQHSQIEGSYKKEIHFFDEKEYSADYNKYHWYFPLPHKLSADAITFEATPNYLYYEEAAQRIRAYKPDMKIILILRNPEKRALSAWSMFHHQMEGIARYAQVYDKRPFKEAIEDELARIDTVNWNNDRRSYVKRGVYYPQVKRFLEVFPREQVLIIEHSELKNSHDAVMEKICDFLNVEHEKIPPLYVLENPVKNSDTYPEELEMLHDFYKPHNEQLFGLLGTSYNW